MNKKEKERTWTHLSPISEDAGGYGYGSARDDSFLGFLNGCWLVDLPLGNGKPLLGPYKLEGMMLA